MLYVPEEDTIVCFVDDLAVIVAVKLPNEVEIYAMEMVRTAKAWLEKTGLILADKKTKVALQKKHCKCRL